MTEKERKNGGKIVTLKSFCRFLQNCFLGFGHGTAGTAVGWFEQYMSPQPEKLIPLLSIWPSLCPDEAMVHFWDSSTLKFLCLPPGKLKEKNFLQDMIKCISIWLSSSPAAMHFCRWCIGSFYLIGKEFLFNWKSIFIKFLI